LGDIATITTLTPSIITLSFYLYNILSASTSTGKEDLKEEMNIVLNRFCVQRGAYVCELFLIEN
jgi:hypothetical protein